MRFLIIFIVLLTQNEAHSLTVDEWYKKYTRPCAFVEVNQVCKKKLDEALKRMAKSRVREILTENNIPLWIATITVVESWFKNDAVSSAGAIAEWQLMPRLVQIYYTKIRRIESVPLRSGSGLKFVETIVETKPTIEACKKLAKDIEISTNIAAWLLIKLYRKYGDWELSIKAYNVGEPRLDNYLKGVGKPLPFQTENYFSQLLAIQKYMEGKR